jgi:hypothetical protein
MTLFQEIGLARRLRGPLTRLQGLLLMRLSSNVIIQILATLGQIVNAASGLVPHQDVVLVATVIAGLQTIVAAIAQFSNTDGTPQSHANVEGAVK